MDKIFTYWDFSLLVLLFFVCGVCLVVLAGKEYVKDQPVSYFLSVTLLVLIPFSMVFVLPELAGKSKKSQVFGFLMLAIACLMVSLWGYRNLPVNMSVEDMIAGNTYYGKTPDVVLGSHRQLQSERVTVSEKIMMGALEFEIIESLVPIRANNDTVTQKHIFLSQKTAVNQTDDKLVETFVGKIRSPNYFRDGVLDMLLAEWPEVSLENVIIIEEKEKHELLKPMLFLFGFMVLFFRFILSARSSYVEHWKV